jgi:hypothetical protein
LQLVDEVYKHLEKGKAEASQRPLYELYCNDEQVENASQDEQAQQAFG